MNATRVLILGAGGMLGHKLLQHLGASGDAWGTVRGRADDYAQYRLCDPSRLIGGVEATRLETVIGVVGRVRPHVVINCIGILKQLPEAGDPIATLRVNALFPQRLALLSEAAGAWLIHVSTDCVFAGRSGGYRETDTADADDLYGRTKLLGEPQHGSALVLRTSMIGRELRSRVGLLEWLIAQRGGTVRGYTNARFSGLTTGAIAAVLGELIGRGDRLTGLFHLGSEPIDKYDLLCRLNRALRLGVSVEPDGAVVVDRTLNSERFWEATALERPRWPAMIDGLAADPTPYDHWRQA